MKMFKPERDALFLLSLLVALAPGCVDSRESGGSVVNASTTSSIADVQAVSSSIEPTAVSTSGQTRQASSTTASSSSVARTSANTVGVTYAANLSLGDACDLSEECASGCCKKNGSARTCTEASACKPKTPTEEECYAKGWFWCAGRCQNESCSDCATYLRCVNVMEKGINRTKVEFASPVDGRAGSCGFNGQYTAADGADGFCRTHKGTLIYATCGLSPTWEDCAAVNGGEKGTYEVAQQRAFQSSAGRDYDLYCFKCARVG